MYISVSFFSGWANSIPLIWPKESKERKTKTNTMKVCNHLCIHKTIGRVFVGVQKGCFGKVGGLVKEPLNGEVLGSNP